MTFEATRKKQLLVLQPRGKALYEDASSFGSKMLAKMGWSRGNGLGKKQHGNLDFIQIRYKNNANGLGYDGLKDNQWTETESQFDNLLKSLNGNGAENPDISSLGEEKLCKVKSLEEQSKLSRARVHYKKFTRGKDIHKYSEKDLANILGKKTLVEVEETPGEKEEVPIETEKPNYESNLIYNTGLTLTDYFKQKMQSKNLTYGLKANCDSSESIKSPEVSEDTVEVQENQVDSVDEKIWMEANQPEPEEPPKKKKKTKRHVAEELEQEEQRAQELDAKPTQKSKKKKSKKQPEEKTDEINSEVTSVPTLSKRANEFEKSTGANAVYSTNVITIPSYVAQKMAKMTVEKFMYSNIANIVGYGLTEKIGIKVVQTKLVDNFNNTDKYALFNMDRMTKQRVNPRKIMSKIKRTKKSIQVI